MRYEIPPSPNKFPTGSRSALLATGCSGGTIAAVRVLAQAGIKVGVISSELLCAASWSRFTSRTYRGPIERESQQFLKLLVEIGEANPGQVLLPTSDETAWLYAEHSPELGRHYRLHQPSVETIRRILDKNLLSQAVQRAGLEILPTWEPESLKALEVSAADLLYPILIKPRTHVQRVHNDKGMVAYSKTELLAKLERFLVREAPAEGSLAAPDARIPLLQHFVDVGQKGVRSVSGYIDETGELFVTRHARKVFQRSKPAGVGICFESLPQDQELSAAVRRLCLELKYFGIFEVEFICFEGSWAVIDFNPRLFNQTGMDVRRGMPLPLMGYLDAAGRTADLRTVVLNSQQERRNLTAVFYDRFTLWAILTAKLVMGHSFAGERAYWRAWRRRNASRTVDFAIDGKDPMPGVVHALSEIVLGIRGFRKFFGSSSPGTAAAQPLSTRAVS